MKILLFLLLSSTVNATTVTVCASGCDQTSVQAAIDLTKTDCTIDTIELKADETFTTLINSSLFLPYRPCTNQVWLRTSKYNLLLPVGYRVDPVRDSTLLAHIRSDSTAVPMLVAGNNDTTLGSFASINLSTDVITLHATAAQVGFSVGTAVSCGPGRSEPRTPPDYVLPNYIGMPGGMVANSKYYVISASGNDIKLSLTKGGSSIDITDTVGLTTDSVGNSIPAVPGYYGPYDSPHCTVWNNAGNWRITGLDFSPNSGVNLDSNIISLGGPESMIQAQVHDIWFDRVVAQGHPFEIGPTSGINISGPRNSVTDSWIDHIKKPGTDSYGIGLVSSSGPTYIRNNYVNASSEPIVTGGASVPIRIPVTKLYIEHNYIDKRPYYGCLRVDTGNVCGVAGPPDTSSCYWSKGYGTYHRDTTVATANCTGGGCYTCSQNGTWVEDKTLPFYPLAFVPKTQIEFKTCAFCKVKSNLIEAGYAGPDGGNNYCVLTSQGFQGEGPVNRTDNLEFTDNWCKDGWAGIAITSGYFPPYAKQVNNVVDNILITGMRFPLMSSGTLPGDIFSRPLTVFGGPMTGNVTKRLTVRPDPVIGIVQWGIAFASPLNGQAATVGEVVSNSILGATQFNFTGNIPGGGSFDNTCGAGGLAQIMNTDKLTNLLMYGSPANWGALSCITPKDTKSTDAAVVFKGADTNILENNRLGTTSPYSASNAMSTMLNDDGTDLGVDIDALTEKLSGVAEGTPGWRDQLNFKVVTGSKFVTFNYTPPDINGCTVNLYTSPARIAGNLHTDTDNSTKQSDLTRTGTILNNPGTRTLVLGTHTNLTVSTVYYYSFQCNEKKLVGQFQTQPLAGAGGQIYYSLGQNTGDNNALIESASDAVFTSPSSTTAVAFAGSHVELTLAINAGSLIYARSVRRNSSNVIISKGNTEAFVTK